MAYDEGLAERIRELFLDRVDVEEKKMFGGLCFMVSNHMCCGIVKETLMAVLADEYLAMQHASEMDFTGRAMKGMVYVSPDGLDSDADLAQWVNICLLFVLFLPPKKKK